MPEWKGRDTDRARELRRDATPAERMLWRYLGRSQAGAKFSRQMPVGPFFADFLCRELKLVVEVDGFSHDLRREHDTRRDRWLAQEGYRVIRFTNEDVLGNTEGVVATVQQEIARRRQALAHP